MTKSDTIDAILELNPTARPDFLAEFPQEELVQYLDRLEVICVRQDPRAGPAPVSSEYHYDAASARRRVP